MAKSLSGRRVTRRDFIKAAAVASGLVAASPLLAACAGTPQAPAGAPGTAASPAAGAPAGGAKELTVWATKEYMEEHNPYLHKALDEIGAKLNVKITLEDLPQSQATSARWAAAIESKKLPDIAKLDQGAVANYQGLGILTDVSDVYAELGKEGEGWLPFGDTMVTIQGKQWSIPTGAYPWPLHYRIDKYKAAGYDVPVKTLDDLLAAGQKVNDPKNNFYAFGFQMNRSDAEGNFIGFLWSFGGAWQTKDDKITCNTKENAAALKWVTDLHKNGLTPPDAVEWDDSGNNTAYLSGRVASVVNTGSIVAKMRGDKMTDLLENTDLGPIPKGPAGKEVAVAGGLAYCIFNTTKDVDLAKKVVSALFSGSYYENYLKTAAGQFWPPRNKYLKMDFFKQDRWMKAIGERVMPLVQPQYWPGTNHPAIGELLLIENNHMGQAIQRVVVDKWTPEQALDEMQKKADAMVEKYKKRG
ncbi:MAG: extracellular solute-binding protein [Chloroflexi bacterium]|nr:extracellular solute-binding protein [Chloroflexota bacterium]